MFGSKRRRRERLRQRPFPPQWLAILQCNVPCYRRLTSEEQKELQGHIQVFLDEKRFEGCGGLEMTDEIRVTIAAQACILLLHRQTDYYPRMKSIFVYPHEYCAQVARPGPASTVVEGPEPRAGESWYRGPVVLSWDQVSKGASDARDGRNVVFHEFAHQLDSEDGQVSGAPRLPRRSMYIAWARVLAREYERLIDDLEHHRRTILDEYGATDPTEFFAVASEAFFERSVALRRRHPALYEQLKRFYQQDPAERVSQGEPRRKGGQKAAPAGGDAGQESP